MNFLSEFKTREVLLGLVVIVLAILLANPFKLYMLSMAGMMTLALLVAAFLAFAALVWGEGKAGDERDVAHQAIVGRIAYLAGSTVLLVSIVVQTLSHKLDITLVLALGVMVLAKVIGAAYVRSRF